MYVVLCGYPPFYGETDADVLAKVRLGNFSFNASDWKNISEDAKNLIRMLLKMNPKDRFTAEQALNHVWVRNKAPAAANVSLTDGKLMDNLKSFRSQNKLKKAALHVIASQLGESQIKALRETFMALDENSDGLLTVNEMKEGLNRCGLKEIPADLQQIMKDVDSDGSGVIDYTEFLAATLDKKVYMAEDVCWQAFRIFDRNGDGKIDKKEIAKVLNSDSDVQEAAAKDLAEIMAELDKNGDGEIDFQEFMAMMRGGN
jgi:calcium-dependent protein kinase